VAAGVTGVAVAGAQPAETANCATVANEWPQGLLVYGIRIVYRRIVNRAGHVDTGRAWLSDRSAGK
jgi:hypothetical protein